MTKLRLAAIPDDRPVKITTEIPATVHRDLVMYAEILARASGEAVSLDPAKLVGPMLQRFMAADKAFRKARGQMQRSNSSRD